MYNIVSINSCSYEQVVGQPITRYVSHLIKGNTL